MAATRTGVVLSEDGGALEKMLPPFKMGVGGPVAGGDAVRPLGAHRRRGRVALVYCLDTGAASGPVNVTAPEPVTNKALSKALGKVLDAPPRRPSPPWRSRRSTARWRSS